MAEQSKLYHRMQQATVVSCFLEFIVAPPSLLNHMHTTDQAMLECLQLSKTKFEVFHRSCWLKLFRIVRNSYPRKCLQWEMDCTDWKGFRLLRPVQFILDSSFRGVLNKAFYYSGLKAMLLWKLCMSCKMVCAACGHLSTPEGGVHYIVMNMVHCYIY